MSLFAMLFSFSTTAFAVENVNDFEVEVDPVPLTSEERLYLINESGFTENQVDSLHPDIARELIEQEAEVVEAGEIGAQMEKPTGIVPFGTIPVNDVTMLYTVVK